MHDPALPPTTRGPRSASSWAYLVFVAINEHGKPREIPALAPTIERERRRMREAEIRRHHRLARRAEIEQGRSGAP